MELVTKTNINTNSSFVTETEIKSNNNDKAYKFFVKAETLRGNNEFKLSISEYLKSIFLDRKNPQTMLGLAIAYKNIQNYEKAIKYFEKAKELCDNNFEIYYHLGITQLVLNRPEDAVSNLQKAIMLNKKHLNSQIQLALAHELMQETDMALAIYQKIIDETPAFLTAYNHKAALLMSLENYTDAAVLFHSILKINPDFYRAYLGIALCFDKLHRTQDAIRYYNKYIEAKPNTINVKRIMQRLRELKENKYSCNNTGYLSLV